MIKIKIFLESISLFIFLFSSFIFAQQKEKEFLIPSVSGEIKINGKGEEVDWEKSKWSANFWMWRPTDSLQANKQTQFKMLRDDQNLYILIEVNTDGSNYTTPNLKRDFEWYGSDSITLLFDTFNDATNAFSFSTNPLGIKADGLISGGNQNYRTDRNSAWDTKWTVDTLIEEGKYTAEIKIPFSAFFYDNKQTSWRFNLYRRNYQGNETSVWIKTPQNQVIGNLGFMGKMIFEKPLDKARNPISIIPYTSIAKFKDFEESKQETKFSFGGDVKIPIGNALNLDLTLNPDFSQVEVDDQVVNLTRFAISLPEKRQFFTQNDDLFKDFGAVNDVTPFFSRRIGVAKDINGKTIENKIIAGARLSGKLNSNLRLGFLNVLTDADIANEIPSNLNTVFTLRQKVFNRSNISFFFIDRRTTEDYDFISEEEERNGVTGVEYNLVSVDSKWNGRAFFHKSYTKGLEEDDIISGVKLQKNTLRHSLGIEIIHGGEDFRSDLGFFRRTGFLKVSPEYTYRIYPKNPNVNSYEISERTFFVYNPKLNYLLTDRWFITSIRKRYLNSSSLDLKINNRYEFLVDGFDPTRSSDGINLPSNSSYRFTEVELGYRSDRRKKFNFESKISYGSFYNGTKFSVENELNWRKQPIFNASLLVNFDTIKLPEPYSSKNIWLISPKLDFTFTKTLSWTTFVQYNSQGENLGINSRMQWRFAPLSDLFIVYNDNYISTDNFSPRYRSFNLKLTYWLNL